VKSAANPTLELLLRTLTLFAFLLAIWPAPPAHASAPARSTSAKQL
jgi:hypothetical protein